MLQFCSSQKCQVPPMFWHLWLTTSPLHHHHLYHLLLQLRRTLCTTTQWSVRVFTTLCMTPTPPQLPCSIPILTLRPFPSLPPPIIYIPMHCFISTLWLLPSLQLFNSIILCDINWALLLLYNYIYIV